MNRTIVESHDINLVRRVLRAAGFECGPTGWRHADGRVSFIDYAGGQWFAVWSNR